MQQLHELLQNAVAGTYTWGVPKLTSRIKDQAAKIFAEECLERVIRNKPVNDMYLHVLEGVPERTPATANTLDPSLFDLSEVETPGKGLGGRPVFIDGVPLAKKGPIKPSVTALLHGAGAGSCRLNFKLAWNKFNSTVQPAAGHHLVISVQQSHTQKSAENCLLLHTTLAATAGLGCQIQISHVHNALDGVKAIEKVDKQQSFIIVKATWLNEEELQKAQETIASGLVTSHVQLVRQIDSAISLHRLTLDSLTASTQDGIDIPTSQLQCVIQAAISTSTAASALRQPARPDETARPGPLQQQYGLPLRGRLTQGANVTPHVQVQMLSAPPRATVSTLSDWQTKLADLEFDMQNCKLCNTEHTSQLQQHSVQLVQHSTSLALLQGHVTDHNDSIGDLVQSIHQCQSHSNDTISSPVVVFPGTLPDLNVPQSQMYSTTQPWLQSLTETDSPGRLHSAAHGMHFDRMSIGLSDHDSLLDIASVSDIEQQPQDGDMPGPAQILPAAGATQHQAAVIPFPDATDDVMQNAVLAYLAPSSGADAVSLSKLLWPDPVKDRSLRKVKVQQTLTALAFLGKARREARVPGSRPLWFLVNPV